MVSYKLSNQLISIEEEEEEDSRSNMAIDMDL